MSCAVSQLQRAETEAGRLAAAPLQRSTQVEDSNLSQGMSCHGLR